MPKFSRNPSDRESSGDNDSDAREDDDDIRDDDITADEDTEDEGVPRRRPRRRGFAIAGLLLLVVVAFAGWLAFEAQSAKSNLEEARAAAQQAREALLKGNAEDTAQHVDAASSHAQAARDATHSVPWTIASVVPWLGSPFKTGQQISDVVLGLTTDVLQPSAQVAAALSPDRLLEGGRVNMQLLRDAAPKLSEISDSATRLDADAKAISAPTYLAAIGDARAQLQTQTSDVTGLLQNTNLAAKLAPSMLGGDGPRTYFMGFQTNAEARGTGGLLGGFGILRFDNGVPTVDALGPNTELDKPFTPISLGIEFDQQYGFQRPSTDLRNSNLSAHFPYAAQIWKSMWAQQSGTNVDGAIAIDPVALSYILGAVGPVTMPDGEVITKDNIVELTESTLYTRYPTDQVARKQYLQDVANEVVRKMTAGVESPRQLLEALGKAVGEGRIAVWSASPADQKLLEETPLAHVVPDDAAPFAGVVINNLGGNKLDYYLRRSISYSADGCDGDTRKSTVTVRVSNTAPAEGLPDYVAGSPGIPFNPEFLLPPATNVISVALLATKNAQLAGVTANGEKVRAFNGSDRGHPLYEAQFYMPAGQTLEIQFSLSEPTSPGAPRVPVQPLIDTVTPVVTVPECSG